MADITKYAPINGGNLISGLKSYFTVLTSKRSVGVVYGFVLVFIAVTIFLAFSPLPNSSSPWVSNIFATGSTSSLTTSSISSNGSNSSSIFSYFNGHNSSPTNNVRSQNHTIEVQQSDLNKEEPLIPQNQTQIGKQEPVKQNGGLEGKVGVNQNQTQIDKNETLKQNEDWDGKVGMLQKKQNQTGEIQDRVEVAKTNQSTIGVPNSASAAKGVTEKGLINNLTSSLMKKKKKNEDLINSLKNCDFFDGNWVKDDSYPLYKPGSCSLIDEQFNCFLNGRPDNDYHRMKWKPKGCTLPRLNGSHMLEMLRGRRLVFVGDSLNRNMWESLICILRNSVKNQSKVYEQHGRHYFRTGASYSFVFEDYRCTIEFFVSPFLVQEWEANDKNGTKKETLRLDIIERSAAHYKDADFIVFNTGHWWTHEKTSKGEDYYQEGSHVYKELNVLEAFRKALTTWGRWVDANINPLKTLVFFRGYSASHFSGGQWNSGGQCDDETEPIKNDTYLTPYPPKMTVLENVLRGMKTHITYLNVTKMTDYRKDGHPSIYRKQKYSEEEKKSPLTFQDCSHWCLPGVPDTWNEILYAELLVNQKQRGKGN